jgi:two-component system chemotaxis response regulator CheB
VTAQRARVEAVVLTGSAGALELLTELVAALPPACPFPVVALLHLPEDGPSLLPSVLRAAAALPVEEASDKVPVHPAHVWVAPPGYHLLIERDRTFALSLDAPERFARPSADVLLCSAADAYGPGLVGAVLSGANDDGAAGAAAVLAHGGEVLVQDPESALVPAMPQAALQVSGALRLSPARLAERLRSLAQAVPP